MAITIIKRPDDFILLYWKDFAAGKGDAENLRSEIRDSWLRCRTNGPDPYDTLLHPQLPAAELTELLADKEELLSTAKPVMAHLHEFVSGSGFVVVLADEQGYIMEVLGNTHSSASSLTDNFFLGASWQESAAGTNAIGTAVVLQSPVQVSGAEHFCQKHHGLTCSAVPIFDRQRKMIGILDISGPSTMAHLHTLGMAVAAAEAIAAQLDILKKNRELAAANKRLTNIFNTISDGVLMVDTLGIVRQMNPAAKEILNDTKEEIVGASIEQLFGNRATLTRQMMSNKERYEDIELMVDTSQETLHCLASGEPLTDEQENVIGGVIILRPIKQIKKLVNRFSGYHATLKFDDIIGESKEILDTKRIASFAATTSSNILLQGESGTGKEIFAQAIHNGSDQRKGPFVAVNCGIIPRELIGSELFGYDAGAFTGAKREGNPGKFELASGGTLFLDEIGDMPLEQQVALLRVLEEKQVTRIGSNKMIPVNVRLICATNKNLLQQVDKGLFRQDLYYRLNVISITLPPLRNRLKDIPMLFMHYFEKLCRARGRRLFIDPEVIHALQQYEWPGNVRELQNVVERAISLTDSGTVTLAHIPQEIRAVIRPNLYSVASEAGNAYSIREQHRLLQKEAERQRILVVLSKHGGNVSAAARELGIARKTLYRKMETYSLDS